MSQITAALGWYSNPVALRPRHPPDNGFTALEIVLRWTYIHAREILLFSVILFFDGWTAIWLQVVLMVLSFPKQFLELAMSMWMRYCRKKIHHRQRNHVSYPSMQQIIEGGPIVAEAARTCKILEGKLLSVKCPWIEKRQKR